MTYSLRYSANFLRKHGKSWLRNMRERWLWQLSMRLLHNHVWHIFLLVLPKHLISCLAGIFANSRQAWLKNFLIRTFIYFYTVDLCEAQESDPRNYPDFNAFFSRRLRPGARPIASDEKHVLSPADGTLSEFGVIEQGCAVQAKGIRYSLAELLGDPRKAPQFRNGYFVTIYLAPHNYHRVHMPLSGKLHSSLFLPGSLLPVNLHAARNFRHLFCRNQRRVCLFEHQAENFALVLVGALIVGSIHTVWQEAIAGSIPDLQLEKGAEMGHFCLGSTVILLLPPSFIPQAGLLSGQTLQMGQPLGHLADL